MGELVHVASLAEAPGRCKHVDVGGRPIALFKVGRTIYATHGACTHRGGRLGQRELAGSDVTCPFHGATFDVTTGQAPGRPLPRAFRPTRSCSRGRPL